jgi:Protein of unknown function (DUF3224)
MTATTFTGTATFTSWDEEPGWDSGAPVPRLAQAVVAFRFAGDLDGTSTSRSVMHYAGEDRGVTVGLERLDVRTAAGDEGSVVLRSEGVFDAEGVTVAWTVVPGTGSGEFAGLGGTGGFTAGPHVKEWAWRLDLAPAGQDGGHG